MVNFGLSWIRIWISSNRKNTENVRTVDTRNLFITNKEKKLKKLPPGDLSGDEGLASPGALVVEEDSVAGVHVVRLTVVYHRPAQFTVQP